MQVTRLDISHFIMVTFIGQEKSCVVPFLCNYHCELGEPFVIKRVARLRNQKDITSQNWLKRNWISFMLT